MGRPELAYELTPLAENYFPSHDTPFTHELLEGLSSLYGRNAPEKILYTAYQKKIHAYRKQLTALLAEDRIDEFCKLRERDGYLLDVQAVERSRWEVTEYHSPIGALLANYPILAQFELQLYQKIFHPAVKRTNLQMGTPYLATFEIPYTSA
jgi:predicted ArsR family transcriptional regulator